ncbi:hypothetical protein [Brucella pseudogrignonensis]|uniref:Uncharacterized protein n=1 Tax=Brucella pseudogrignonensis TaxID=419475 RepID=A0ABU1M5H6_9HYPH|nr:hypothetical protein [Brucella pseudogrignonensis]MDR6431295.1 hypothetical protein [Brucella pseudogrignonensis]
MTDVIGLPESIDWDNPCARAKALKDAYYDRLAGGTAQRVRFRHGENEQEVQTSVLQGNLSILRREMQDAEDECRKLNGLPPINRRFAIVGGTRRR